jgi:hypothetical protein
VASRTVAPSSSDKATMAMGADAGVGRTVSVTRRI